MMISTVRAGGRPADRHYETEAALVAALRRHDPDASAHWVRGFRGQLLSVARRYLPREGDAEDAVQDAFLQAFRALPRFRGDASLSTWLFRITTNQALMTLRRQSRRREAPWAGAFDSAEWLLTQPDPGPGPESRLIEAERREAVAASVGRLPDRYQVVVRLVYYEGLDTGAAARRLGTTPNAVKQRLRRARQRLAGMLQPGSVGTSSGRLATRPAPTATVDPAQHEPVDQVGAQARSRCA